MAFRRERNIREVYEDRFGPERGGPYRRSNFGRPEEDYGRGFEYENQRFYPSGPPRNYHGEGPHFAGEHRAGPPRRGPDEGYQYYRGGREEPPPGRMGEFRPGRGGPPPHHPGGRGQGSYPPPRPMPPHGPEVGDDTVMQAILNLDRGEEHEGMRRKAPFPPVRERSPIRRDVPPSPHSRSGSSISSRGYSPERAKAHPYGPPPHPGKKREKPSAPFITASRDGSPHSSASVSKDEPLSTDMGVEEPPLSTEDPAPFEEFHDRRAQAIAAKVRDIEKMYRQDCETFGMVVKMLISKEPSLEKLLQGPLRENLGEIRDRCLDDLRGFIAGLDDRTPHHSAAAPEPTM